MKEIRNTLLQKEAVKYYAYNFYTPTGSSSNPKRILDDWRISFHGGLSYRVAETSPQLNSFEREYINELKSGHHFGLDGTYFLNNIFGLGLQGNLFKSSHSVVAMGHTTSGTMATGLLFDNISILFIGPQVKMRFIKTSTMNGFLIGGSIGYIKYTDNGGFITQAKLESETLGLNSDFDYDYRLSNSLSIGAGLSIKLGVLSSFTLTEGNQVQTIELDPDTYESLLRIDLSIGIRFH